MFLVIVDSDRAAVQLMAHRVSGEERLDLTVRQRFPCDLASKRLGRAPFLHTHVESFVGRRKHFQPVYRPTLLRCGRFLWISEFTSNQNVQGVKGTSRQM